MSYAWRHNTLPNTELWIILYVLGKHTRSRSKLKSLNCLNTTSRRSESWEPREQALEPHYHEQYGRLGITNYVRYLPPARSWAHVVAGNHVEDASKRRTEPQQEASGPWDGLQSISEVDERVDLQENHEAPWSEGVADNPILNSAPLPLSVRWQIEIDSATTMTDPSSSSLAESVPSLCFSGSSACPSDQASFSCSICYMMFRGIHAQRSLRRHTAQKHGVWGLKPWPCEIPSCHKTFARQDAQIRHYHGKQPGFFPPSGRHGSRKISPIAEPEANKSDRFRAAHAEYQIENNATQPEKISDRHITWSENRFTSVMSTDQDERERRSITQDNNEIGQGHVNDEDGNTTQVQYDDEIHVSHQEGDRQEKSTAIGEHVLGVRSASDDNDDFKQRDEAAEGDELPNVSSPSTEYKSSRFSEVRDWLADIPFRSRGYNSQSTGRTRAASASQEGTTLSTISKKSTARKRVRDESQDGDGEEEDRKRRRRPRIRQDQGEVASEMFACPFAKRYPRKYTRCWDFVFEKDKFADLKQHFARHHLDSVHCPRCGLEFYGDDKHAERNNHLLQTPRCEPVDLSGRYNGITADQWERIKVKKPRAMSEEKYWQQTYTILFGSAALPGHPYHEDFRALALRMDSLELTNTLRHILEGRLRAVIEDSQQAGTLPNMFDDPTTAGLPTLIQGAVESAVATVIVGPSFQPPKLTLSKQASDSAYASTDAHHLSADRSCSNDTTAPSLDPPLPQAHDESPGLWTHPTGVSPPSLFVQDTQTRSERLEDLLNDYTWFEGDANSIDVNIGG